MVNPLTQEPKKRKFSAKALEANSSEGEIMPSSSAGPSKKQPREEQNEYALGGMRNPAVAVSKLHQVRQVGKEIHAAWLNFANEHPVVLDAAVHYGSQEAEIDETALGRWRERLESPLGAKTPDGITLKEQVEFRFPLNADLGTRGE